MPTPHYETGLSSENRVSTMVSPAEAKMQIYAILQNSERLQLNETWYLVSSAWWKQWINYVNQSEETTDLNRPTRPGPIDNKPLVSPASLVSTSGGARLLSDLVEDLDYKLLPEQAWNLLHVAYGGGPTLARQVVKALDRKLFIEIYPLMLRVTYHQPKTTNSSAKIEERNLDISKTAKVAELDKAVRSLFEISSDKNIVLYNAFDSPPIEIPSNTNETLEELGIIYSQPISVEQSPDSSNNFTTSSAFSSFPSSSFDASRGFSNVTSILGNIPPRSSSLASKTFAPNLSSFSSSFSTSSPSTSLASSPSISPFSSSPSSSSSSYYSSKRGLCGLMNLGNTCFMNSALQCLSNTEELTNYFLNDSYLNDINRKNPLGMEGRLAESFGNLIKEMWNGHNSQIAPRNFKVTISRFASQFTGFGQHDTQELLAFLLDGLHEDLNRIHNKPYIESKESDGRPDNEVAAEAWRNHLKRNDSIIVDLFQGQFKSRLICPTCAHVSVTFDPFMYLSLPLANRVLRVKKVAAGKPVVIYQVNSRGKIGNLRQEIASMSGVPPSSLVIAEVFKNQFQKVFSDDETLREISSNGTLYAFEVPDRRDVFYPETIVLPVTQRISNPRHFSSHAKSARVSSYFFGDPFLISVSRRGTTYQQLYRLIWEHMKNFIKSEHLNGKEEFNSPEEERMEVEGEISKIKGESYYSFKIFNEVTNKEREIVDVGEPVKFCERESLIIEWDRRYHDTVYDKQAAEAHTIHPSCRKSQDESLTLTSCLEQFLTQERLGADDQWYCPKCKEFKQATKKMDLWKLPEILVVHLKRFSNKLFREKLDTFVDYPLSGFDLSDYMLSKDEANPPIYDLYAVANHFGSLGGGHYTAYAKNPEKRSWYQFDDSSVSRTDEV